MSYACSNVTTHSREIPGVVLPREVLPNVLMGNVFCNHQNYLITFSKLPQGSLVGRVQQGNCMIENVTTHIVQNQSFFRLQSPKIITFYPERCALVVGTYGLLGGMKKPSSHPPLSTNTQWCQAGNGIHREMCIHFDSILNQPPLTEQIVSRNMPAFGTLLRHSDSYIRSTANVILQKLLRLNAETRNIIQEAKSAFNALESNLTNLLYVDKAFSSLSPFEFTAVEKVLFQLRSTCHEINEFRVRLSVLERQTCLHRMDHAQIKLHMDDLVHAQSNRTDFPKETVSWSMSYALASSMFGAGLSISAVAMGSAAALAGLGVSTASISSSGMNRTVSCALVEQPNAAEVEFRQLTQSCFLNVHQNFGPIIRAMDLIYDLLARCISNLENAFFGCECGDKPEIQRMVREIEWDIFRVEWSGLLELIGQYLSEIHDR